MKYKVYSCEQSLYFSALDGFKVFEKAFFIVILKLRGHVNGKKRIV